MNTERSGVLPDRTVLVLPIGAHEQHGPHLPFDTDTLIVNAVVARAVSAVDDGRLYVAPVLPVSASDEHVSFAGTLSAGTEAVAATILGIRRSAWWARGMCIVNGHGGNTDAVRQAASAMEHEGLAYSVWSPPPTLRGDLHAGHVETSIMMHLDPSRVRHDLLEVGALADDPVALVATMRSGGVAAVSESGVIGDPRTATADHGRHLLDMYADSLARFLSESLRNWSSRDD